MENLAALEKEVEKVLQPSSEYELACLIRDGAPAQKYWNSVYVPVRITGTGLAERNLADGSKQLVYRPEADYISADFLERCNGLPIRLDHSADTSEIVSQVVGSVVLPFVKEMPNGGKEPWGVARIFDPVVAKVAQKYGLSTSPGVHLKTEYVVQTIDGVEVRVEGANDIIFFDNLGIVDVGVWDKDGQNPPGIDLKNARLDSAKPLGSLTTMRGLMADATGAVGSVKNKLTEENLEKFAKHIMMGLKEFFSDAYDTAEPAKEGGEEKSVAAKVEKAEKAGELKGEEEELKELRGEKKDNFTWSEGLKNKVAELKEAERKERGDSKDCGDEADMPFDKKDGKFDNTDKVYSMNTRSVADRKIQGDEVGALRAELDALKKRIQERDGRQFTAAEYEANTNKVGELRAEYKPVMDKLLIPFPEAMASEPAEAYERRLLGKIARKVDKYKNSEADAEAVLDSVKLLPELKKVLIDSALSMQDKIISSLKSPIRGVVKNQVGSSTVYETLGTSSMFFDSVMEEGGARNIVGVISPTGGMMQQVR